MMMIYGLLCTKLGTCRPLCSSGYIYIYIYIYYLDLEPLLIYVHIVNLLYNI